LKLSDKSSKFVTNNYGTR